MTRWAAVIGSPIEHSLSPVLHTTAYRLAGLDWEYRRFQVGQDEVADFVAKLDDNCVGLSVTMPCKQAIIPSLDTVESLGKAVGAVNTVVFSAGMSAGFNTDVYGIVSAIVDVAGASLAEFAAANRAQGREAVILGTRATASSALAAVTSLGYHQVSVVGRSFQGQGTVLMAGNRLGVNFEPLLWKRPAQVVEACRRASLIVSTVPGDVSAQLDCEPTTDQMILDVTYAGGATGLQQRFVQAGAAVASPLAMLVHQGIAQVKLMSGREVPFDPVYEAVCAAAQEQTQGR